MNESSIGMIQRLNAWMPFVFFSPQLYGREAQSIGPIANRKNLLDNLVSEWRRRGGACERGRKGEWQMLAGNDHLFIHLLSHIFLFSIVAFVWLKFICCLNFFFAHTFVCIHYGPKCVAYRILQWVRPRLALRIAFDLWNYFVPFHVNLLAVE